MKIKREIRIVIITLSLIFVLIALTTCDSQAVLTSAPIQGSTETPTNVPTATASPTLKIRDVPSPERTLEDVNARLKANEKRVLSGDTFTNNLYERPFTSGDMIYQPDVNILNVSIASDENFIYFTIELEDLDPQTQALTATYGIEFDRTKTGRGDMLVWVHEVKNDWSMDNLKVFTDPDKSIGGPNPIRGDEGYAGNGYENEVKLEGDKVAYARISPYAPTQVQIAVSRILLDNSTKFLWGAWADKGIRDPMLFDYDDHFGLSAAGSPIKNSVDYPIKDIYSLDNTCRLPFGFTTILDIRGKCNSSIVCQLITKCVRKFVCISNTVCK